MKPGPKLAAEAVDLVAVAEAGMAAAEVEGVAAIAVVVAAAAVAAAFVNIKIMQMTQAFKACVFVFRSDFALYTNSTFGLCGMIPALYPISRSLTTASLPSSP